MGVRIRWRAAEARTQQRVHQRTGRSRQQTWKQDRRGISTGTLKLTELSPSESPLVHRRRSEDRVKIYIKEVADHANKLGNKTGVASPFSTSHNSPLQDHPLYAAQIEMPGSKSNKRTHSMSEQNFDDGRAHFQHYAQGPDGRGRAK